MARRSTLTTDELRLLKLDGVQLGRIATVGKDGVPHVVPTGWTFNEELGTLDVTGRDVSQTRKFADVIRTGMAALVIDGVESPGWNPWGLEIRGRAEAINGPPSLIRITPTAVASWNLEARLGR